MKTRSTEEAMAVLNARYPAEIRLARAIGILQYVRDGKFNTFTIRREMEGHGFIIPGQGRVFWLGASVNHDYFEPIGERFKYSAIEDGKNVHERTIEWWKVKGEFDTDETRDWAKNELGRYL